MKGRILRNLMAMLGLAGLISACQGQPAAAVVQPVAKPAQTATAVRAPTATADHSTATPVIPKQAASRDPLWTYQTQGAVWSSPVVQDGVVYFGSDDKGLYALDAGSGELKWKFETAGMVRCRPAVGVASLYISSDDGFVYAIDPATGKEQWKADIHNNLKGRLSPDNDYNWDYLQSSPVLAEGRVYVGSVDGQLYALDAATGQEAWLFKTGDRIRSSPTVAQGKVFFGSWDGFIYAVDATSGQEAWKFDTSGQWVPVQPSPLVVDGVVYIGGRGHREFALDAETGKQKWAFQYVQGWVESSAALQNGVVYVGSSEDRALYAIDSQTGKLRWSLAADGVVFSSPLVADGVVYAGTAHWTDGIGYSFYALDIQAGETAKRLVPGQALWRVETGPTLDTSPAKVHGVVSSPALQDGVVYFGGLDGRLYAVSAGL